MSGHQARPVHRQRPQRPRPIRRSRAAGRVEHTSLLAALLRSRRPHRPRHRAVAAARPAVRLSPGPLGLLMAAVVLATGSGAVGGLRFATPQDHVEVTRLATPAPPVAQPAGLEAFSPYLPQVSCSPTAMRGAIALGNLLRATYPGTSYGIERGCGSDGMGSEHYEGRAVDWMASRRDPAKLAQVQSMLQWLFKPDAAGRPYANARRLGIMYVIWDDRIWGAYRPGDGWRPYSTCANRPQPAYDTVCHRDHVHISLSWAGAAGRTSFWTGRVAGTDYGPCRPADLNWASPYTGPRSTPCPDHRTVLAPAGSSPVLAALYRASGAHLGPGARGPLVTAVQRALRVPADGSFGPMTGAAVSAFRVAHRLRAGQVVDAATWRALLGARPTGAGTAPSPSPSPRPAPRPTPPPAGPLAPHVTRVLTYGSTGPAVTAVQRLLKVTPSGWFGPRTQAAVRSFQAARSIPTTGNVGPLTWAALNRLAVGGGVR